MMTTESTENVDHSALQNLSFFDVKEVYDRAYSVKEADEVQFHALLAEAVKMDLAYRRQLREKSHDRTQETPKTLNKTLKELISDKPTKVA